MRIAGNLAVGPHVVTIPGTGDIGHLNQNIAAGSLRLKVDDLAVMNRLLENIDHSA